MTYLVENYRGVEIEKRKDSKMYYVLMPGAAKGGYMTIGGARAAIQRLQAENA